MKNTKFSKVVATGMVLAMVASSNVFAITDIGQTIKTGTVVKAPVYNVLMPTNIPLNIDPFLLGSGATNTLYTGNIEVVNKSNIPVQVDITSSVLAGTGVAVATPLELTTASSVVTNLNKLFKLDAVVVTKTGLVINTTTKDALEVVGMTYAGTSKSAITPVVTGKKMSTISFALDRATITADTGIYNAGTTADTAVVSGASVFTLAGEVNPNAKWAIADLAVNFVVSLKGVASTTLAEITPTNYPTLNGGHRLMGINSSEFTPAAYVEPLLGTPGSLGTTLAFTEGTLGNGSKKATKPVTVTIYNTATGEVALNVPTTGYTFTVGTTGATLGLSTFTLTAPTITALPGGSTEYRVEVVYDDGLNTMVSEVFTK